VSEIDIRCEGQTGSPAWLEACREFIAAALLELGAGDWELSVLFCDDPFMRELNRRYRGLEEPTDVLSFSQEPDPAHRAPAQAPVAGDIVISLDTLGRNALRKGQPRETELKRLLIHGMLHLQGLDHSEGADAEMLRIQERLLERLREKRIEL
jgi:probable rRNA maturation factor